MASITPSPVNFSGNLGNLCFVIREGKHYVRRKRGTVKPAKLNEPCRRNVERNKITLRNSSMVHEALKKYAVFFKDGIFANDMLSRIKKCMDDRLETHLASLSGLELNSEHRLDRHVGLPVCIIKTKKDYIVVDMKFHSHPTFRMESKNNCYRYEIILFLWDNRSVHPRETFVIKEWIYNDEAVPHYELLFERVKKEKNYLLVLKLLGGINGKSEEMMRDRAMLILSGGKL